MGKLFSITALRDLYLRFSFFRAGMKSTTTDLGDGTIVHSWVPKAPSYSKPNLLLVHGFGANAMWQWNDYLPSLTPHFNLYIPDLIFFGQSYTTRPDRSESFQARCLMGVMDRQGVRKMDAMGVSYGGFVTYSMAAQFPERLEKLVLCCSGVCLEEKDMEDGILAGNSVEEAVSLLLPETPEKLNQLLSLTFAKPPKRELPSFIVNDLLETMCEKYRKQKTELIQTLHKGRKFSNLPKISKPTLILWGGKDLVFPMELAHRLKSHIGEKGELVVIEDAGHAINVEKPKEVAEHVKTFLLHRFGNNGY